MYYKKYSFQANSNMTAVSLGKHFVISYQKINTSIIVLFGNVEEMKCLCAVCTLLLISYLMICHLCTRKTVL